MKDRQLFRGFAAFGSLGAVGLLAHAEANTLPQLRRENRYQTQSIQSPLCAAPLGRDRIQLVWLASVTIEIKLLIRRLR